MLELTNEDIEGLVANVFLATLGIEVASAGPPVPGGEVSSSLVGITGTWDGAVIVACDRDLAVRFAMAMFALAESEVSDDEINDALGELANMVGGNFKSMLPPICNLSLPTVVEGREYRVRLPGADVVRELDFGVGAAHVRVTVAERQGRSQATSGAQV
jgi:chemotaxis protein CheX